MSRIPRLPPDQISDAAKPLLQAGTQIMGFEMHDGLDMARNPDLLAGVSQMVMSIW